MLQCCCTLSNVISVLKCTPKASSIRYCLKKKFKSKQYVILLAAPPPIYWGALAPPDPLAPGGAHPPLLASACVAAKIPHPTPRPHPPHPGPGRAQGPNPWGGVGGFLQPHMPRPEVGGAPSLGLGCVGARAPHRGHGKEIDYFPTRV